MSQQADDVSLKRGGDRKSENQDCNDLSWEEAL